MRLSVFLPLTFALGVPGGCVSPNKPIVDAQVKADAKVGLANSTQEQQTRQGGTSGGDLTQTNNDTVLLRSLIRWNGVVDLVGIVSAVAVMGWLVWMFGYRPGNWQRKEAWSNGNAQPK